MVTTGMWYLYTIWSGCSSDVSWLVRGKHLLLVLVAVYGFQKHLPHYVNVPVIFSCSVTFYISNFPLVQWGCFIFLWTHTYIHSACCFYNIMQSRNNKEDKEKHTYILCMCVHPYVNTDTYICVCVRAYIHISYVFISSAIKKCSWSNHFIQYAVFLQCANQKCLEFINFFWYSH